MHDIIWFFAHWVLARLCTDHLSQRSGDLYPAAGFFGGGVDLWCAHRGSHGKVQGAARLTVLILAFLGFVIAGFALSKWLPLSCLLIFLNGVAIMASASLMLSLVQLITTDAMRGRVMSVYNLAFRAGIPLGSLALGKLIPIFGVGTALSGAGFMLVAVCLYFLLAKGQLN